MAIASPSTTQAQDTCHYPSMVTRHAWGTTPNDKVTGIFASLTLYKPKNIRDGQFLLCALPDSVLIHQNLKSLMPILRHILWSANVALSGRYLVQCRRAAFARTQAAPGRQGFSWQPDLRRRGVERRLEIPHERVLRLLSTPTLIRCCFLCNAHARDGPLRYHDLAESAGWVRTEYSTLDVLTSGVLRPGPLRPLP